MNADELFEQLGYRKTTDNKTFIQYTNAAKNEDVTFNLKNKIYIVAYDDGLWVEICIKLHRAINLKCEELGWLNKKEEGKN